MACQLTAALMISPLTVSRLVEAHMGGAFVWGKSDCCSGPARVFAALTGVDVLRRVDYPSRAKALADMEAAGGALAYIGQWLRPHGLVPVSERAGALGVIVAERGFHGAICLQPGAWAIKAQQGFTVVKVVDAIWGLANWEGGA